jgi:eukaryotic-like serine/threonine-protein kinase
MNHVNPDRWQQVKKVFTEAVQREPSQREAFLAEACVGDADLRAEVEELLASYQTEFMAQPAVGEVADLIAGEKRDLKSGQRINQYEIVRPIGAGGMGVVYLAQDTKLRRQVALKLLPHELTDNQDRLRRFEQEARAASALNHPNILTIHEIGTSEGASFIATEFIDGETLRQKMNAERFSPTAILELATQVVSALATAHEAGIVHRDIKPENIMLRRDGIVKVLDFGLTKTLATGASVAQGVPTQLAQTDPGVVMGTVHYMSPEQARGQAVDGRTDTWSVGVVLYELVAGQKPFIGETASDVIAAILKTDPKPLKQLAPDTPDELQRIVLKTLRSDKEARYQTAKELLVDLRSLKQELEFSAKLARSVTSAPTGAANSSEAAAASSAVPTQAASSHPTSSAEYIISGIRRHRIAIAISVVLLAAAVIAVGLYWHARTFNPAIESIAVLPFRNESKDSDTDYLSDGITESLINSLSRLPHLKVMARTTIFRYRDRDSDAQRAGRELGVAAVLTGKVLKQGDALVIQADLVRVSDGTEIWGEKYQRRLADIFAIQAELSQEISDRLRLHLSGAEREELTKHPTDNPEAYELYLKGYHSLYKFTDEGIKKSLDHFQQAIDKDSRYATAYAGLAEAYLVSTAIMDAAEASLKAKQAAQKAITLDASLAEAHYALALVSFEFDLDWPGAEREFQQAIKLKPNYALAYDWYGYYLGMLGRFDEAHVQLRHGLEIDPLSLPINTDLGTVCYWQRRYDQALEQLRKTSELDPAFPPMLQFRAETYAAMGRYAEALQEFEQIKASTTTFSTEGFIGYVYAKWGKKAEAERVLNALQGRAKKGFVAPDALAIVYTGLGEKDKAFQAWQSSCRKVGALQAVKVEPIFDDLRSDPRFADLVRCVGLTP